jgi:hypothetical protein
MIDVDEVRRSLAMIADEARPATLGPAALDGARRRRRRQRISVTVVLLLLAGVLVPITVLNVRHDAVPPVVDLPDGPMAPHVVTAYAAGQNWYVLDPAAGRYRRVDGGSVASVSPNLQLYTDVATKTGQTTVLRITSTSGAGPNTFLTMAGDGLVPQWSPNGNWLAVPVLEIAADSLDADHGFTEIVFVDVLNGTMQRKKINLGDGRYGGWVQWADDGTLLVGTERQRYQRDGVAVVRRDGKELSWHALPAGGSCPPDDPSAVPPAHDGKLLTCRQDGSSQVYRVFDPRRGTTGPELGRISLPLDLRATAVSWEGDDGPVLQMIEPTNDSGAYNVRVARLSTGELEALPRGLPAETLQLLVGSSDGMSAAGRKLSF